jgi:hypothetical protein
VTRLRSDFWVAAYLRRVAHEGAMATLRRRGAPEAGAIWLIVERSRDEIALYAPAPQNLIMKHDDVGIERCFTAAFDEIWRDRLSVEEKIAREIHFDSDLFLIEVEDKEGRLFADIMTFTA